MISCDVWGSAHTKEGFEQLRRAFRHSYDGKETTTPHHCEIWRTVITKFAHFEIIPFGGRLNAISIFRMVSSLDRQ